MNNGSTDVFCDVIALAGSPIARTAWQQNLVIHFCDTSRASRGFAGFNLEEMPWTPDHRAEQNFFLDILDRATARTAWQNLNYTPSIDYNLAAFTRMVADFDPALGIHVPHGRLDIPVAPELPRAVHPSLRFPRQLPMPPVRARRHHLIEHHRRRSMTASAGAHHRIIGPLRSLIY